MISLVVWSMETSGSLLFIFFKEHLMGGGGGGLLLIGPLNTALPSIVYSIY